jgi:hypothetical protein
MHEFIIHKLPRPNADDILFVHSLSIENLKRFVLQRRRYSTDDNPAEALAVYEAIGSRQLNTRKFACLTAYIAETFRGKITQGLYSEGSNLGLIVNRGDIANRLLIFNGDVANLGRQLLKKTIIPANVKGIWGTESDLVARLGELSKNSRNPLTEPRLRGIAFEARLFDGILPADVSHIYIENNLEEDAMVAVFELEKLCEKREQTGDRRGPDGTFTNSISRISPARLKRSH